MRLKSHTSRYKLYNTKKFNIRPNLTALSLTVLCPALSKQIKCRMKLKKLFPDQVNFAFADVHGGLKLCFWVNERVRG